MREIETYVDINAAPTIVWGILTDFSNYWRWNPLIRNVRGEARQGSTIEVTEQLNGGSLCVSPSQVTIAQRTVKQVYEPRELLWRGRGLGTWLFETERRFRIEARPGGVRFHQSERFHGLLALIRWRRRNRRLRPAFGAMNDALKVRAESVHAQYTTAQRLRGRS